VERTLQIPFCNRENKTAFYRHALLLLVFFLLSQPAFSAVIPDFTLTVNKIDETCLGNGSLTFSVSGVDPLATIEYKVYQLPDITNPIAIQSSGSLAGRSSGTYRIVATQTLNGESNSQAQEITINNNIVPLTYTISSTNALCGNDGSMTINITTGIAVQYEIISGPVIRPLQSSNVFNMIPAGVYEVRVFNNCGDGTVVTHTLQSDAPSIAISDVGFPNNALLSCNTITIENTLTPPAGVSLSYPINAQLAVFAPDGTNVANIPLSYATGQPDSLDITTDIPFYYDQDYHYTLTITDGCGNVYTNDNLVHKKLEVLLAPNKAECGQYFLSVMPFNYFPGVYVTYTALEPGFDPVVFNSGHPGPFAEDSINYGAFTMPVPFGHYAISITDGCGHTATDDVTLIDEPTDPAASIEPYAGCMSNFSSVKISLNGIDLVGAVIMIAPATYTHSLPDDVSDQITAEDGLVLNNMPEGHYMVHLTDECGVEYDFEFDVPGLATNPVANVRADCEIGKGAVRIRVNSAELLSVIMTAAPAGFSQSLPYDVSFNLTPDGIFSMNNLQPGDYTFEAANNCGLTNTVTVTIPAYAVTANDFTLTRHCGSFDIHLNHTANTDVGQTFWLQKFYAATNTWGHPLTEAVYVEGTIPNNTNSLFVNNNATTLNLNYDGTFRILKRFETFENGNTGQYKNCIEAIQTFTFDDTFHITAEKITCGGTSADVKVIADGVPPFMYKIIAKNGLSFLVDNGPNNIFTNLDPAIYTFWVKESCNNIATHDINVNELPSVAHANQPAGMSACDDSSNDGVETFSLSSQNATIFGTQNPADFTLTYHISLDDATTGMNPLPDNYPTGNHTIYARLKYNANATCYDIVSFEVTVNPYPVLQMQTSWGICPGHNTLITADSGFDSYLWSSGQHTQSINVSQPGQFSLQVTKNGCSATYAIDVVATVPATIHHIDTSDWTDNDNSIKVILDGNNSDDYVYSIDGVHFQASNIFNNLTPGPYTISVQDIYHCGLITEDVYLLNYIRYFTPNGDGFHEYWRVKFSEVEPHLITYIFDRYGKLITGFGVDSPGWDGTLNGEKLPSTDYWFLVIRENGKELRGHFAMKR
jgi:gliding motility-associated-like protein